MRFTPRGQIDIRAKVDAARLCFEVRDTGIGICADDREALFDEFFQVDDAAAEHSRGAGLGSSHRRSGRLERAASSAR